MAVLVPTLMGFETEQRQSKEAVASGRVVDTSSINPDEGSARKRP